MQRERLAPTTQATSGAAGAGVAMFSHRAPDQLNPAQRRRSLHQVLGDRHRAWCSYTHVACGLRCFSPTTLGWEPLSLHLPPRTGRSQLPQVLSVEARQRLGTRATHHRNRVRLMTPSAAGLCVSAGVRLQRTDIERARGLLRVEQGTGRQDRSPRLSPRRLTARRASGKRSRPAPWVLTGLDPHAPLPIGTAQHISAHTQQTAGSTHGPGIHPLRQCCATHRRAAGGAVRTIPLVLGPQALDTTTRHLRSPRPPLATIRRPCDLLPCGDPPLPTSASPHAAACHRLPRLGRHAPAPRPTVGRRRSLPPLWGDLPPSPSRIARASAGDARYRGLPDGAARWARRTRSSRWVRAVRGACLSPSPRPAVSDVSQWAGGRGPSRCRAACALLPPWVSRATRPHPPHPGPPEAPLDPAGQRRQPDAPPGWAPPPRRPDRVPHGLASLGPALRGAWPWPWRHRSRGAGR